MSSYIENRYHTPEIIPPEPDYEQYIDLSADSRLHMQSYISPWGFAGVVGHWGIAYSKERIDFIVEQNFGKDYVIPSVGFDTVWKVPQGYSFEHAVEDELEVGSRLIQEALALNMLEPENIEYLFLGSGSPLVDHPDIDRYGVTLAELNGLKHLNPETAIHEKYLACHSGYKNIRDALLDPQFHGKTCLFVNLEGLTRLMPDIAPEHCDSLSPYFFGNGGNAFVMVPGETLELVCDGKGRPIEEERIVPDTRGALAARVPYEHLYDEEYLNPKSGNIVQDKNNVELIVLPKPPGGRMIDMKGGLTGVLFAGRGREKVPATINTVHARDLIAHPERRFTKKPIKTVIHPAGLDVVNRVNATTSADIVSEWGYKRDGNTSASASTTVFIRKSKTLKRGDDILWASMGAGSKNGVFRAKVGKGILQSEN